MPALKPGTIIPTDEEDAIINAGILADPDTYELTDADFVRLRALQVGRPITGQTKERITLSLSPEVVSAFRATGTDWQLRIEAVLKDWLLHHPDAGL